MTYHLLRKDNIVTIRGVLLVPVFLGLAGAMLLAGCSSKPDSRDASPAKRIEVELAPLERGTKAESDLLRVGTHIAWYNVNVAGFEAKSRSSKPTDDTAVTYFYYPIVSKSHPGVAKIQELEKKYA